MGTRLVLIAQGTMLERAVDAGNARLRVDCDDPHFRDRLGTHVTICDVVAAEVATWPLARGLAFAFDRTYLCGSPCAEVGATLLSNPLSVVLLVLGVVALPYVSGLLARPPGGQGVSDLEARFMGRLERGYVDDRNWSHAPPVGKLRWE
jgi:hypothetical protein